MSIDLSQFHQVFLEESFEGLDVMESALMELDPEDIDSETINAIFRCAHSIKGGSATFGFSEIADFTHVLETLLDQVRDGARNISNSEVDLFLQSVDCMREMLHLVQDGDNSGTEKSRQLKNTFNQILGASESTPMAEASANSDSGAEVTWSVIFVPSENILKTGNDPVRIINALSELGNVEVHFTENQLPTLSALDPEKLYLKWNIEVTGSIEQEQIKEVFEWVEDDAEILMERKPAVTTSPIEHWHIHFAPGEAILKAGNDVTKMLQVLSGMASSYEVTAEVSRVPKLVGMDPEVCYLYWDILISGQFSAEMIEDVFEWVKDESTVHIEKIDQQAIAKDQGVVAEDSGERKSSPSTNTPKPNAKKASGKEASSIRVGIDKIDNLINMVGELVITQSMLGQLGTDFDVTKTPKLLEGLGQLEQNTRELQESVMRIRMLPISFAFSRFPRMVRDVGQQLDKKIQLEMFGEHTELDKTVMEKIGDPLVHLVRNAIDHGIEKPEDRIAAGKPEVGNVVLNAYHQGGNVVIEITDDGKGLDREVILKKAREKEIVSDMEAVGLSDEQVYDLIFQPGFSTAHSVSDLSGRGVGMDVVRRNILALNGVVEIQSKKGQGSTIRIRLPLTLAILDGQLVRVGNNTYIFPLVSIVESIQCKKDNVNHIAGGCSVFKLRDDYVPIVRLNEVFSVSAEHDDLEQALMVVVESDGDKVGIVVDELLAQQQVVIKSLEKNYKRVEGVSGATILGDGTVALIVDVPGVVKVAGADAASIAENNSVFMHGQAVAHPHENISQC